MFVCLFIYLLDLCKFSNCFVQYKAAGVRKNVVRMNTEIFFLFFEIFICLQTHDTYPSSEQETDKQKKVNLGPSCRITERSGL